MLNILLFFVFALSEQNIFVRKEIVDLPAGQKYDMKVKIHIHNEREESIFDVNVDDQWGPSFLVSENAINNNVCNFTEIPPKTNVTCENIWVPQIDGLFTPAPVRISYKQSQEDEYPKFVVGHTFAEYPIQILPEAFYKRSFTSHKRSLIVFFLLSCNGILIPYIKYANTKKKNEKHIRTREAKSQL